MTIDASSDLFLFYLTILFTGNKPVSTYEEILTYFVWSEFVTFWWVTWGGGGSKQMMTKSDMGGEGGSKNAIFGVTYFLHGPLGWTSSVKLFLDEWTKKYFSFFTTSVHVNIQSAQNNTFLFIFLRNHIRAVSYSNLGVIW